MTQMITTTISNELWNIAKEKNLKWSECMAAGIQKLANQEVSMGYGETIIKETDKAEVEKLKRAMFQMQEHILSLSDENDRLKNRKN